MSPSRVARQVALERGACASPIPRFQPGLRGARGRIFREIAARREALRFLESGGGFSGAVQITQQNRA